METSGDRYGKRRMQIIGGIRIRIRHRKAAVNIIAAAAELCAKAQVKPVIPRRVEIEIHVRTGNAPHAERQLTGGRQHAATGRNRKLPVQLKTFDVDFGVVVAGVEWTGNVIGAVNLNRERGVFGDTKIFVRRTAVDLQNKLRVHSDDAAQETCHRATARNRENGIDFDAVAVNSRVRIDIENLSDDFRGAIEVQIQTFHADGERERSVDVDDAGKGQQTTRGNLEVRAGSQIDGDVVDGRHADRNAIHIQFKMNTTAERKARAVIRAAGGQTDFGRDAVIRSRCVVSDQQRAVGRERKQCQRGGGVAARKSDGFGSQCGCGRNRQTS